MFEDDLLAGVAQLHALAAQIAAGIDPETSGAVAVEALAEVFAGARQVDLLTVRLIERADRTGEYRCDGAASITAFVRSVANETNPWASKRVHLGRALADSLPATAKGWEAGHLGLDHAAVIHRATAKIGDSDLIAALESYLALLAPTMTPAELAAAADDLRSQAEPEETAAENAKKRAAQTFHLSQTTDGIWRADGWLDAEAGLIVSTAITAFLRKADPVGDPLSESVGRRRADALVDICRQALTHADKCAGTGTTMTRHTIVVGLSHQQLLDGLGTAGVTGGRNLPAATARRMACDANIIPVVYGADSEELDYGRSRRTVTAGQRKALDIRDGGCIGPACDRPPMMTEAHHRLDWIKGGKTKTEELESVCLFHHHLLHEGGWTLTLDHDPARTPWFHPPGGRPPRKGQRRGLLNHNHYPRRT